MMEKSVIVVGGGIVGSAIAWKLAQAGARVILLDKNGVGTGASSKSFSWVNAHNAGRRDYHALRMAAIAEWQQLDSPMQKACGMVWTGTLGCMESDAEKLEAQASQLTAMGRVTEVINGKKIAELEPNLRIVPSVGLYCVSEGAVDAAKSAKTFASAAATLGATVLAGVHVTDLTESTATCTVSTNAGIFSADTVVIACGVGTTPLTGKLGMKFPTANRYGVIVRTQPVAPCLNRVFLSPDLHMRQDADGTILAATDYMGAPVGGDKKLDPIATSEHLIRLLNKQFKHEVQFKADHVTFGERPVPEDGMPVVGYVEGHPRVYVAMMHSGVTLAPIIAKLVADEILNNTKSNLLDPFRCNRFDIKEKDKGEGDNKI